ncbi:MAG: hypothetical protein PT958_04565 [Firmicutes bacterium]|nr:hypothetical protein [Bacillota bacterium]
MSKLWLRLDNAALIFPAVRRKGWSNVFRLSATLTEEIDPLLLQQAVNALKPRFPSMYVRLRTGLFWYYLEEAAAPAVRQDYAYPLAYMGQKELRTCCLRVLYYRQRIAVEFFHSLTDGTGGSVYLRSLVAEYVRLKYGAAIPATDGVLSPEEAPRPEELEDSFLRYASKYALSRKEPDAMRLSGTPEPDGFLHLITGVVPTSALLDAAHAHQSTVTVFLAAVMAQVILEMQAERTPLTRQKPVKITVPVNLRQLYGSRTLRNFALTLNPGVDPRLGSYTLDELCRAIAGQLAAEATPQQMAGRMAANVNPQKLPLLKIAPLFIKNIALRMVYASVGERKGCLNISNLGRLTLPEALHPYVQRLEFIIGVQATYPNNCSVATLGETTCINMIRNIREASLEQRFFSRLVELGIPVTIESNKRR